MISDLDDLRIWAKALATGVLLRPATQRERLDWQPWGELGTAYGLGIIYANGFVGHAGSILGYSTIAYYLPEEDATMRERATNRGFRRREC